MKSPMTNRITGAFAVLGLWLLLMGEVTVGNVAAGMLVAVFVLALFPHPMRSRWRAPPRRPPHKPCRTPPLPP